MRGLCIKCKHDESLTGLYCAACQEQAKYSCIQSNHPIICHECLVIAGRKDFREQYKNGDI